MEKDVNGVGPQTSCVLRFVKQEGAAEIGCHNSVGGSASLVEL